MLLIVQNEAKAQEDWEETGEIENAEVIIEKDRTIELPRPIELMKKFRQLRSILILRHKSTLWRKPLHRQ